MAHFKRPWTDDDVAKLRDLAGKMPTREIAREIGRTEAGVAMEASKLKISLSTERRVGRRPNQALAQEDSPPRLH